MIDIHGYTSRWERLHQWRISALFPRDTRESMRRSLLRLLAVAHSQRLDLVPLVSNLAIEHRGRNRRILRRLAKHLSNGMPLVTAVEVTPGVLSDRQVLAMRFALQIGILDVTYRDLIAESSGTVSEIVASSRKTAVYISVMLAVLVFVVSFLWAFIVPLFVIISDQASDDFKIPKLIQTVNAWTQSIEPAYLLLLVVMIPLVPLLMNTKASRVVKRWMISRDCYFVAQMYRADLLELLARAIEAGRPVPSALSTLARHHFDKRIRNGLLFARNEVEQGAGVWASLCDAKLLTVVEATAIEIADTTDMRSLVMRRLADHKRESAFGKGIVLIQWFQSFAIIAVAAIVLVIVYTFFSFITGAIFELS